ncbi:MAG: hypothetical protein ACR2QJ_08400 [Geminicoccaceae bacterium]
MRAIPSVLSCCAVLFGLAAASDLRAEVVKVTPELTVFTDETSPSTDGRPTVLRGSATKRGTVESSDLGYIEPPQYQVVAGERLWLTDPENGQVILCNKRRTSRVGSRYVSCIKGRLPYTIYD